MAYTRSVIITGGTVNLGYEAALVIARKHPDWLVVLCSRSDTKQAALAINKTLRQKNTTYLPLDLSDSASIRAFASQWTENKNPPIQALLLNAALQFPAPGKMVTTKDGIEATFGITHAGHALLFHLLCPCLAQSARVVVTSSGVHDPSLTTGMPVPVYTSADDLAHPPPALAEGDGRLHYCNAKLANVLWTYALHARLAQRVPDRAITVTAMDPGLMPGTGLAREYPPVLKFLWNYILPRLRWLMNPLLGNNVHSAADSGASLARLAVSDDVAGVSGKYFEGKKERDSSQDSYDVEKQDDLWNWSVKWSAQNEEEVKRFEAFA